MKLDRSIKDAPSDVQSVQTRLKDLEFILSQIGRARPMNSECVEDPAAESYWNTRKEKLRSDFAEFRDFAAQKKVLGLLAEDIDVLRALLGFMES